MAVVPFERPRRDPGGQTVGAQSIGQNTDDHDDAKARHLIATALDDTLVVEAAAGTGKTTGLVGRIVRILAEGRTTVEKIVAWLEERKLV